LKRSSNQLDTVEVIVKFGKPKPYCLKFHVELDEAFIAVHGCKAKNCPYFTYVKKVYLFA